MFKWIEITSGTKITGDILVCQKGVKDSIALCTSLETGTDCNGDLVSIAVLPDGECYWNYWEEHPTHYAVVKGEGF